MAGPWEELPCSGRVSVIKIGNGGNQYSQAKDRHVTPSRNEVTAVSCRYGLGF